MNEVLRITNLGQSFGSTRVLDKVNLSLAVGERLAILGPSGSGKTTLLRLIAGLEPPAEGDIAIAGQPASRAGAVLLAPEHRHVALVFQGLALFPHLRALDQIAFAARGRGGAVQAKNLLERVGLGHRAQARLDELSGGERQRIALARALAQVPKLILMDEPFASLDDEKRAEMRELLRSLLDRTETTLILVSHSREDAFDLAHRVVILDQGRPIVDDSMESVLTRPRHAAAVRALGLGQIVTGEITDRGVAETAFGKVRVATETNPGRAFLLIRPDQPRITTNGTGVEAEVVSLELRPSEQGAVRRIAVVKVGDRKLRGVMSGPKLSVGDRAWVQVEGECETIEP